MDRASAEGNVWGFLAGVAGAKTLVYDPTHPPTLSQPSTHPFFPAGDFTEQESFYLALSITVRGH